jgi:hypothetical protein
MNNFRIWKSEKRGNQVLNRFGFASLLNGFYLWNLDFWWIELESEFQNTMNTNFKNSEYKKQNTKDRIYSRNTVGNFWRVLVGISN